MERIIYEENGVVWSDTVLVTYEGEKRVTFFCSADTLYAITKGTYEKLLQKKPASDEAAKKQNLLAKLIKVGIRGLLIAYGDDILDLFFGKENHPKPGKKDDLIEWYTDMFFRYVVSEGMKNDIVIEGIQQEDESGTLISVSGLIARSLGSSQETSGEPSEGRGANS